MYHIFQVHNYKGGELGCSVNLSKESVAGELVEYFFYGMDLDVDNVKEEMQRKYDKSTSIYAGGDDYVLEIYESKADGKLHKVKASDFFDECIRLMKEWNE